ncbi:solute carrier family 41 member 1 [Ixodes scapularis]
MPPQNESLEPAKTGSSIVDSAESSDDLVQTAAAAMLDLSAAEPGLATIHGVRRGLPKDPEDLRSSRAAISEKLVLLEKAPEALDEFSCLLGTPHQESCCVFLAQVFPSFMLAGAGMVVAGLLLDIVQQEDHIMILPDVGPRPEALLCLCGPFKYFA